MVEGSDQEREKPGCQRGRAKGPLWIQVRRQPGHRSDGELQLQRSRVGYHWVKRHGVGDDDVYFRKQPGHRGHGETA